LEAIGMSDRDDPFDTIVARLRRDDPSFWADMRKIADPPARSRAAYASIGAIGWGLGSLFLIALAGWAGLVSAVVVAVLLIWFTSDRHRPRSIRRRRPRRPPGGRSR
jgi:hypothetical protein